MYVLYVYTYRFRTGRPELGYSAHFVGNTLVLETMSKSSKKPQTHAVDFSFQSYQWYMLTVVYVHHRLKSSELCCYVNGKAVMNAEINLPNTDGVRKEEGERVEKREKERERRREGETEREGGKRRERDCTVLALRFMISVFLEAHQVPEKMLCFKVRWQLSTSSENHWDMKP